MNTAQKAWNELKDVCEKTPIVLTYLTNILPSEIFDVLDEDGNNIFMLACGYNVQAVKYLLESDNCTKSVVERINNYGDSSLQIASKTSIDIVKILLDSDKFTKEFVMSHDFDSPIYSMCHTYNTSISYIKKSPKYLDVSTFEILEDDEIDDANEYKPKKKLFAGWFSK